MMHPTLLAVAALCAVLSCSLRSARAADSHAQTTPAARPTVADNEPEYWIGRILVPNPACPEITFAVTFVKQADAWTGRFSISPGCGVSGMFDVPVGEITYTSDTIHFVTPPPPAENVYEMKLDATGKSGLGKLMINRVQDVPIRIRRANKSEVMNIAPRRPQTPELPLPYENREVVVTSSIDGVKLGGTVSIPGSGPLVGPDGKRPAFLLLSDENPQDRDHAEGTHKPGLVIADLLARQGAIVARFDDRGNGLSEGSYLDSTFEQSAADAASIVAFLKSLPEVDPKRVGVIGRGEGAAIAARAAAASPDIGLAILLAPSARPLKEVMIAQEKRRLESQSEEPAYIRARIERYTKILDLAMLPDKQDDMRQAVRDDIEAQRMAGRNLSSMNQFQIDDLMQVRADYLTQPRTVARLAENPAPYLEKVRCPVLLLVGALDVAVPPADTLPGVQEALKRGKNAKVTTRTFPRMNHCFQPCNTGYEDEYDLIETTISPEVINAIVEWVLSKP